VQLQRQVKSKKASFACFVNANGYEVPLELDFRGNRNLKILLSIAMW